MELKIEDYVRTKKDGIGKIIKIKPFMNDTHIFLDSEKGDITFQTKNRVCKVCNEESIIKSSPNIIDLIEVGDYVNGHLVIKRHNDLMLEDTFDLVQDEDIKSIVTKQQFETMQYVVKE